MHQNHHDNPFLPTLRSLAWLILSVPILWSCASNSDPVQDDGTEVSLEKDLVTFYLPQAVTQVAPLAQGHFLDLLPYNTERHQIKPRFVFIDRSERIVAPLNAMVVRLNFLHVVYYREGVVVWSGSLLYGQKESPLLSTREGFHLGVVSEVSGHKVSFQDGDVIFRKSLSTERDEHHTLVDGDRQLYLYHYIFPANSDSQKP